MALVFADRVLETCSAPGTGSVSLLGATSGYQTFSAAVGDANTCYYTIADQSGANWEVGLGTYATAGNTLARTTVLSSSNSGSLVNFSSGTQNVFLDYPASVATPLASPAFTGTPVAPTATADTNTTQLATTAYVVGQAGSTPSDLAPTAAAGTSLKYSRQDHVHSNRATLTTKSTSYTLVAADANTEIDTTAAIIVPNSIFTGGDVIIITNTNTSSITLTTSALTCYLDGVTTAKTSLTLLARSTCALKFSSASIVYAMGKGLS